MMSTHSRRVTEVVARFAATARDPGASRVHEATRSLVDVLAVALAGREEPAVAAVRGFVETEPAAGGAVVWGSRVRRGPSQAALLNGTAGHALDFDDACPSMPLHPGTVLWPALLAVLDSDVEESVPGRLVEAADVGNAVLRGIGEVLPMGAHYGRGWHATATIGRLAAVAALARLRGLDEVTTRHALGTVASMAAGQLANFGSGTKAVHAGLAARDAVVAVSLAEHGLDAAADQLENPSGFLALFGDPQLEAIAGLGERLEFWRAQWPQDWSLKRYPSCYGTHRAIDAALSLRSEIDVEKIEGVEVWVSPRSLRPLLQRPPSSGMEAKFSLPYAVARALLRGALGIGDFSNDALADPGVAEVMRRVRVSGLDEPPGRPDLAGEGYARVAVRLVDGTATHGWTHHTRGDARNPLSNTEVDDKFRTTVTAAGWTVAGVERLLGLARRALTDRCALSDLLQALPDTDHRQGANE